MAFSFQKGKSDKVASKDKGDAPKQPNLTLKFKLPDAEKAQFLCNLFEKTSAKGLKYWSGTQSDPETHEKLSYITLFLNKQGGYDVIHKEVDAPKSEKGKKVAELKKVTKEGSAMLASGDGEEGSFFLFPYKKFVRK